VKIFNKKEVERGEQRKEGQRESSDSFLPFPTASF
jgi:hypothetical protein